jgi:hypothetical protein
MHDVLTDELLREQLRRRGADAVRQYSWDATAEDSATFSSA